MAEGPLATVSLIVAPGDGREALAQQRAWAIPAASAEAFAQAMTERYGAPVMESLATVGMMIDASERDAAAGHLFWSTGSGNG